MKKVHFSNWLFRMMAILFAGVSMVRAQVEGPNGHYYKVVLEPNLLWEEAKSHAQESTYQGVHGYLATITSAEEDQFIENLRQQAAPGGYGSLWVGGSQVGTGTLPTDSWYWVNGEGPIPTRAGGDGYSNWQPGEPNDYSGPQSEGYLSIGHFNNFGWNDEPNDRHIFGYVVEYPVGVVNKVSVLATDPIATSGARSMDIPSQPVVDPAIFTFSREGDLSLDLPVYFSVHGTAVNGSDYNEIAKSIVIPAGQNAVTLQIVPRSDLQTALTRTKTVGIRLEPSSILTPSAAYIIDGDRREAAAIVRPYSQSLPDFLEMAVPRSGFVYKENDAVTFLVTATGGAAGAAQIPFYSMDTPDGPITLIGYGTPISPSNGLRTYKLTWQDPPPGVHAIIARLTEDPSSLHTTGIQITIPGTIEPPQVGIRFVEPGTEPVPNADYAVGSLEVTRTGSTAENLQVFYAVSGTATANIDYEGLQGYVVIPAGKNSARIIITAIDDAIDEPTETVMVTLTSPTGQPSGNAATIYTIDSSHSSAQVSIVDNDDSAATVSVSITVVDAQIHEEATDVAGRFRIVRTGPTNNSLTVTMQYAGTAGPGADYQSLPPSLTIPVGASEAFLNVLPLNDTNVEGEETVIARFAAVPGAAYAIDPDHQSATMAILDDDRSTENIVVRVSAIDPVATEGQPDGGAANDPAVFQITRSGSASEAVRVFFSMHGTAKNGEDYETIPDSILMAAGQNSAEIRIVPKPGENTSVHKYEIVQQGGLSWAAARSAAGQAIYNNVHGHLATITSAAEDQYIENLRQQAGGPVLWVGGYQDATEMSITEGWKWVNDEGPISGTNGGQSYANWLSGEPNDYWGAGSENAMAIGWLNTFGWNDQGENVGAAGYVVEFDVAVSTSPREIMETVGIRLEPMTTKPATPIYSIDANFRSAGAVIFDGQATLDGAIEVAIPSAGEVLQANDVEFLIEAYHPTTAIGSVDIYVDDVKVGTSTVPIPMTATEDTSVIEHHWKWAAAVAGEHVLQAKATLGGGRIVSSSRIPFTVQGVVDTTPTVTISATDAEATEFPPTADGFNPARFVFTRSGSTTNDLQVFFSVHGTAVNGEDYERIASPITIPTGRQSVELQIVPLSDGPVTGAHKYEIVAEGGLSWDAARAEAEAMSFEGVKGHLATITSLTEDQLIESLRQEAGSPNLWVGGYQEPSETSITEGWKWVNNEGAIPGMNGSEGGYANWSPGEPNDYWGPASENHLVIGWAGFGWNDQTLNIPAQGYVVEFDVATSEPGQVELMETVGIRLEPSPVASILPTYKIDENHDSAAAVIFEGSAPANGALEVAIPSSGEEFEPNAVEFVVAGYHPTMDVSVVEFFVDEVKVGESVIVFDRPISGGVIEHHLAWTNPSAGPHVLEAKAPLSNDAVLVSSKIPFTVNGPANTRPVARISKPAEGATFLETETIHAVAGGTDADGTVVKIELLLDGTVIDSKEGATLEKDFKAEVGAHTLTARATDDAGGIGVSAPVHILVRHPDTVAFVHRELPAGYSPGVSFAVRLRADPPEGTFAYAIEDKPPTGWRVVEVSNDGAWDSVNGKVKFGPFTDDVARTLTYRVEPPLTASGRYEFSGNGSVNGALYPTTGDTFVELVQQYHPADSNQDWRIPLAEVTAYAAAWKAGRSWPAGPVPIPLSYVTRAYLIWQHGEVYRFEAAAGAPPACWVAGNSGPRAALAAMAIGAAQRSVLGDMRSGAAAQVKISVTPASGSSGYAVEEKPPRGWVVSNISNEGTYDSATGIIRWGVFADATARTLTYVVIPPATVTSVGVFAGQLSYDGQLFEIGAGSALENSNSVTIDGASPIRINALLPTPTGTILNISGPAGQTAVIEGSTDFTDWTEVKSIFIPNGSVNCTDDGAASGRKFYRLRVQ